MGLYPDLPEIIGNEIRDYFIRVMFFHVLIRFAHRPDTGRCRKRKAREIS